MAGRFVLLALVMVATGCSHNNKSNNVNEESKLSYRYVFNGCDTGTQNFGSKHEMCDGLLDEIRNKGCAQTTRYAAYKDGCQEFGKLEDRTATTQTGSTRSGAAPTTCGTTTCSTTQFCMQSKNHTNNADATTPMCLSRTTPGFSCDDATKLAKAQFPTSNNCMGLIECSELDGQFVITCWLPGS